MRSDYFYVVICYWILSLKGIYTSEKTWICNTNADDKTNWIMGDYLNNCTGFHFPEQFQAICLTSLRKITTNSIYLPLTGDVELREQSEITLSEDSNSCVMVRDDIQQRSYADPQCWKNENRAIPDAERPPCETDDVIFPKDATYEVTQTPFHQRTKSLTIRGEKIQSVNSLYQSSYGCSEFLAPIYYYPGVDLCHTSVMYSYICNLRKSWRKITCSSPVVVSGHCSLFCGSVMVIEAQKSFNIKNFVEAFKKDQPADAYYIVLPDTTEPTYQITLTDKEEFTGDSIYHAQKFYDRIKNDLASWGIKSLKANFSGFSIAPEKEIRNAMEILFGTLFMVILMFGVLFLVYTGPLKNTNILPSSFRIPFGNGFRRTRPFIFARFKNKDDGTMSMGSSVVSLDKSFENPMYGQQMASTSIASSMQTVQEVEELGDDKIKEILESEFSNPLYGEDKITVEEVDD